jgi:uncharacterized protein (AIM24 family)
MLDAEHTVQPATTPGLSLQNPYCARYAVDGDVMARQGAMVAYRGDLKIQTKGQGLGKFLKRAVTGEGVALMEVSGRGEIWFADESRNVFVLDVGHDDQYTISGKSVLCFDSSLSYEIRMVKGAGMVGGGLFNCVFDGAGKLAVTSHGEPMVIPVSPDAPVFVDTDAVVAWSSALQASVNRSESMRSFVKGGSGEAFQLKLEGSGFVVVQPSEGLPYPTDSSGGGLGGLLSN